MNAGAKSELKPSVDTNGDTVYSKPFKLTSNTARVGAFVKRTGGNASATVQLQGGMSNVETTDDNDWVDIGSALTVNADRVQKIDATDAIYLWYRWKATSSGAGATIEARTVGLTY